MRFENIFKNIFSYGASLSEMAVSSIEGNVKFAVEQLNAEPEKIYNARFGEPDELLDETYTGASITGTAQISKDLFLKNVAIIGTTGSGKTSVNAICTGLNCGDASLIIHDPSGQQQNLLARDFERRGFDVYCFDPNDYLHSININPLDNIKDQQDMHQVAAQLTDAPLGDTSSDPFWKLAATGALSTFIGLLFLQPKEFRTVANLKLLLERFASIKEKETVHELASKAPDALYAEFFALASSNDKTLKSILLTCSAALNLWRSEGVCKVTANTTVDFSNFRKKKSVLFIRNTTSRAKYFQSLISLVLDQMLATFMEELPSKDTLPIYFIIDEAATLNLPSLDQIISNNRKYEICIMLFFQALGQVYGNWGKESGSVILSNCTSKLFYGAMDQKTASDISEILGKTTVTDDKGKEIVTDLMLPQNIRMLAFNEAIFISGGHKPYKVQVTPYYLSPKLRKRTQGEPFVYTNPNPIKKIPLLPLK